MRRILISIGLTLAALAGPAHAGPEADATVAIDNDDYDSALILYTKAVDAAGADTQARASALFDRAEGGVRTAHDAQALADYAEALQLSKDPAFKALILTGRGDLYAQTRKYPEALADYSAALALKPDLVGVLTARAQVYGRMKNTELALADYEAELKVNPKYPRALRGRAQLMGLPDPLPVKESPW